MHYDTKKKKGWTLKSYLHLILSVLHDANNRKFIHFEDSPYSFQHSI